MDRGHFNIENHHAGTGEKTCKIRIHSQLLEKGSSPNHALGVPDGLLFAATTLDYTKLALHSNTPLSMRVSYMGRDTVCLMWGVKD